ncbi:MAG: hypothetical protein R6W83_12370 [Cryobacterium sp.]
MTLRLAAVLTLADLSIAELCSARLDGEVFAVGDCWCPIDEIDGAENRARALGRLASPRLIIERRSAAWLYGDGPEPPVHDFCLNAHTRSRLSSSARVRIRQGHCSAEHTQLVAGLSVTLPLRTAVDLARFSDEEPERLLPVLSRLLRRAGPHALPRAQQDCHRDAAPTTARALRRLAAAAAYPV